jgi:hypothetical protein
MGQIYRLPEVGWWATLFFTLPVYIMRGALRQVIEVREMFTQTIGALAQASRCSGPVHVKSQRERPDHLG